MPTPVYPEYPALWDQARRAAQAPVDHRFARSVEAITRARGADWCTAVLGRSFAGLRHATVAEAQLLRLAHERNLDPPLPDEIAAARREAADHRTLVAGQRQRQRDHDRREWTVAQGRAGVPVELLQVRANMRGGGRSAHRGGGPLHHVVPTVDLWSGSDRRPRRHPAGRALCESEHRRRPLQLGEASHEPATCVRCLAWTTRVRSAPAVGAPSPRNVPDPAQQTQPAGSTGPTRSLEAPAVDPGAVLEAARAATAHKRGNPVLGCHVLNTAVWVDLSSWPRAWETATYLAELGYQVSGPSPAPDGYGWLVTVSGWSTLGLGERVLELERVVRDLEIRHGDVAAEAVSRYRDNLRRGMGQDVARRQAVADLPLTSQPPTRLGPAVSERDLTVGPLEHRGALVRVAAAQQAWQVLATADAAGAAVDMYFECRQVHGYPVDRAQAAAVAEVSEGAQGAYKIALEAARYGSAASGHHRPSRPAPDSNSASHTLGASQPGGTGSPRMRPPPTRAAGQPHHRGR